MIKFFNNSIRCFGVFLCCSVFLSLNINAQETTNYQGEYVINDTIRGDVDLNYFVKRNDTILHGDFKFAKVFPVEGKENQFFSIEYQGMFEDDQKKDDWFFSYKSLEPNHEYSIDKLSLNTKTSGTANDIYAHFENGIASKKWSIVRYTFKDSKALDTVYTTTARFNRGKLDGKFTSVSENLNVSGTFNEGLIDETWIFETEEYKEIRTFEEGVLVDITFEFLKKDGVDKTSVEFIGFDITYSAGDESELWERIVLDKTYFEIFKKAKIRVNENAKFEYQSTIIESIQNSNQFIKNAFLALNKVDGFSIWNNIRGSEEFNLPNVRVRKIAFTENENQLIKEVQEDYALADSLITKFKNHESLEVGKLNFESLNKFDEIIRIHEARLKELDDVLNLIASSSLEFLKRDELLKVYQVDLRFPESFTYQYNGEEKTEKLDFPDIQKNDFNLAYVHEVVHEIAKDVQKCNEEVGEIYDQLRKQESLSENEELLVNKKKAIESFFSDSEQEDYNTYHDYFANSIISQANDVMAEYGKLGLDDKKNKVEGFIDCLDSLMQFKEDLTEFEDKVKRIDEEYTRVVFNPFLMSDISERVKERIYDAYEDYLLPYVLKDIRSNLDCNKLDGKSENLEIIYNAMLDIRGRDTKEEERNLKRVRDINKILSILNIELN